MTNQQFKEKSKKFLNEYADNIFRFHEKINEVRPVNAWHASKLDSCLRGVYYEREGVKKPKERAKFIENVFYEGKMKELELILRLILEEYEILDSQSALINEELNAKGRPDAIVLKDGKTQCIEIKTVNSRAFWYRVKDGNFDPYPAHVKQLTYYLHELREKYPEITGVLKYRSRDDGTELNVFIDYNEQIWQECEAQFKVLDVCWSDKILPPIPDTTIYDQDKKRWVVNYKAQYCDYHHYCLEDESWLKKAESQVNYMNKLK